MQEPNPRDARREALEAGGSPLFGRLDWRHRLPVADTIVDLCLRPDGGVRIQVESALEQEEGLRDVTKYRAIPANVGLERREVGEIAASLGQNADSSLKRMVKELVRLEYVEAERDFDAPRNPASPGRRQE